MASNLKEQIRDQIDGQNEESKELIIEKESHKFMEIFDRVFSENDTESVDLDTEDGVIEDILVALIKKIKLLIKQKFVNEVILNQTGEDESDSETEA